MIHSEEDNSDYYAHLLFNRTAGECACTLPVLRRMGVCRVCLGSVGQREVLDGYAADCAAMGYWTDEGYVTAEERPTESGTTTAAAAASPTETSRGRRLRVDGIRWWGTALMLVVMDTLMQ